MEWGLTKAQEQQVLGKLKTKFPGAELAGAVPMDIEGDGSFQIVSATLSDKGLATSVVTSGKAPLVPGGRAAAASRLAPEGAQLLAATFEKARSITDLSIALNYTYQTLVTSGERTDRHRLEPHRNRVQAAQRRVHAQAHGNADEDFSRHPDLQFADLFLFLR